MQCVKSSFSCGVVRSHSGRIPGCIFFFEEDSMQKQSRFMGSMVLFLMALMVLLGCPTGGGTDGGGTESGGADSGSGGGGGGGGGSSDTTPADVKAALNFAAQVNKDFDGEYISHVPGTAKVALIKDLTIPKEDLADPVLAALGLSVFSVSRAAGDTDSPLTIPSQVTFIVNAGKKLTVNTQGKVSNLGTITVDKNGQAGTIEVSGGTIEASGPIEVKGEITVTSGTLTVNDTLTVETGGTLEAAGTVTVAASGKLEVAGTITVSGELTVAEGGALEAAGTVTVSSGGTLEAEGTVTVTASGTVKVEEGGSVEVADSGSLSLAGTIEAEGSVTVEGEISGNGTITGSGDVALGDNTSEDIVVEKVFPANTLNGAEDGLAAAIVSAKAASPHGVVRLTEAFYTAANSATGPLVIDGDATDNTTAYTVRGLGTGTDAPALSVGIILANNNVTLDGVKIAVSDTAKAATSAYSSYKTALSIGRHSGTAYTGGTSGSSAAACNDVTVQNCDISYTVNSDMGAGIYVAAVDPNPPAHLTITGNTISISRTVNAATQAIVFSRYGAGVTITNNVLSASNGSSGTSDTPASALLIQIHPDNAAGEPGEISGNTLKGGEFDFYVSSRNTGDLIGNTALVTDKFGTADSTWISSAGETNSFYKKLITALLPQAKGPAGNGEGFGRLLIALGGTKGGGTGQKFALEYYEIKDGKVEAVNYWSPGITNNAYNNTETGSESASSSGGIRGRFLLDSNGAVGSANGTFKWTRTDTTGTNLPSS
jgi:hypothetical protein